MGEFGWHIRKTAFIEVVNIVADADLITSFQDVDGFLLLVVNVQRRTPFWRDLNDEIVECTPSILTGDFENEIPTGARLESQPFP